jgi:hypothetical protein
VHRLPRRHSGEQVAALICSLLPIMHPLPAFDALDRVDALGDAHRKCEIDIASADGRGYIGGDCHDRGLDEFPPCRGEREIVVGMSPEI